MDSEQQKKKIWTLLLIIVVYYMYTGYLFILRNLLNVFRVLHIF